MNEARTSGLYDPETVRTMVLAAVWAGHHDVAIGDDEQINRVASRILAAHPAPPTPAPSELHEHCVRMAAEAWEQSYALFGAWCDAARAREHFRAAVSERLAQSAQLAACNAAASTQASELLSAAEWLDGHDTIVTVESEHSGARWFLPYARGGAGNTEVSWRSAILAAARSLGWPGGGK